MTKYKLAICGGTFDLLHAGHKEFIKDALNLSDKIILGITSNFYTQTFKKGAPIEDLKIRKESVEQFLDSIGASDRVKIISIDNAYEPFLETSSEYQAIFVTSQTEKTALEINLKRKQNGISELDVVNVPLELAEDGYEISSTRIRNGEINRDGRLYLNPQWNNKNLILPENLRSSLQKPWGEVLNEVPRDIDSSKTVVVGDATAKKFNEKKVNQFLSVVDFLIHREIKFHQLSELGFTGENIQKVDNPHGVITPELIQTVKRTFNKRTQTVILISGEDDLAVLPVLLIAPLGFSIFYGQPDEGLVRVEVTEENKEKAYQLVKKFILEN